MSRADKWTKLTFLGNLLIKPLFNTVATALLIENLSGNSLQDEGYLDIRPLSWVIATGIAAFCAVGEAVAHRAFNSNNQAASEDSGFALVHLGLASEKDIVEPLINESEPEEKPGYATQLIAWMKKYLLYLADYSTHTMNYNTSLTLGSHFLKPSNISTENNILLQAAILLFALGGAMAEFRTCKHNMEIEMGEFKQLMRYGSVQSEACPAEQKHSLRSDTISKINFLVEFFSIFVNSCVYLASIIDNDSDKETGFTTPALIAGSIWGIFVASFTASLHFIVNVQHQSHDSISAAKKNVRIKPLICWQKTQIGVDRINHVSEMSSQAGSTIRFLYPSYGLAANIGISIFSTVLGMSLTRADSRTCQNNAIRYYSKL